ncbi:hypothetical protein VNI00_010310 [Paramarasmius palmivorus]|uniref:BCAS3 WD40 domain-containing protein n=1 Tax=Paramarasmius palmivorus TaxID=297713 RepID=A0AAW0CJ34_9AGAR
MPSRHNRNVRKNKDTTTKDNAQSQPVIYQQPTPSSRPSPDTYPISLPETTLRGRPPGPGPGIGAVLPTPTHSLSEERASLPTPPLPEALDMGFGERSVVQERADMETGMAEALEMAEEFGSEQPLLDLGWDIDPPSITEPSGVRKAEAALIRSPVLDRAPSPLSEAEPDVAVFTPSPSPSPTPVLVRDMPSPPDLDTASAPVVPPHIRSPVLVSAPSLLPPEVEPAEAAIPPQPRSPPLSERAGPSHSHPRLPVTGMDPVSEADVPSSRRSRAPVAPPSSPPPRVLSQAAVRAPSPPMETAPELVVLHSDFDPTPAPARSPSPPTSPRTIVRPKTSVSTVASSPKGQASSPRTYTALASSPKTPSNSQTLTLPPLPPTAAGVSPPAVSRPVSFGRFTGAGASHSSVSSSGFGEPTDMEGTIRPRHGHGHGRSVTEDDNYHQQQIHRPRPRQQQQPQQEYTQRRMSYGQGYLDQRDRGGSLPMIQNHSQHRPHARTRSGISQVMNPSTNRSDTVISARWDLGIPGRRLLMLAYHPLGMQVWDCTKLDEVVEVLNLPTLDKLLGRRGEECEFVHAGVLGGQQGLIGILVSPKTRTSSIKTSQLLVYSLVKHALVKHVTIPGLANGGGRFEVSNEAGFVVVSTTHPPALQVLSLESFEPVHRIPASELAVFCAPYPPSASDESRRNSFALSQEAGLGAPFSLEGEEVEHIEQTPPQPAPVFSVSGRLLAYANASSASSSGDVPMLNAMGSTAAATLHSASMAALASLSEQIANLNRGTGVAGAPGGASDLGNTAMKVGGGLLSGMKSLGGMAYKGAVNVSNGSNGSGGGGIGAFANRFFSRSAPAATNTVTRGGVEEESGAEEESEYARASSNASDNSGIGRSVTVLDMKENPPAVVTRFIASALQPVANIWFSQDGTSVLVAPRDGQVVHVYGIRSNPVAKIREESSEATEGDGSGSPKSQSRMPMIPDAPPSHVYDLRRGRTPAVVEAASWSLDQRWVAFGTRKRTVHVFAVNPYGGKSDVRSHLEGVVRNYTDVPPLSTELSPLVRLRVVRHPGPDQPKVPLAFTFLDSPCIAESTMPTNLLPAVISSPSLAPQLSYGSASSNHTVLSSSSPSARSEPISPNRPQASSRPKNYQDVLVFDPTDGVLSLRRIMISAKTRSRESSGSILGVGASAAAGISRSLPGMGKLAMSVSVSPNTPSGVHGSGPAQTMGADSGPTDLNGKDSTVATWNLRRRKDWGEIKKPLEEARRNSYDHLAAEGGVAKGKTKSNGQADWLAQAELSTFHKSPRVLPRSIYLTHQFSFHALGEDYHALIRRYQFDISGSKIEVRKGVEVSAYPAGPGTSESFVEGGAFLRRASSSFDEPLASALAGEVDYTPPQTILPMLPNGHPGSKPRSFKNSIPIRSLGDGMSESLGRFKREMRKVRSPKMVPSSDTTTTSTSVPLEFDEEDEDFLLKEEDTSPSASGSGSGSEENHPQTSGTGAGAGTTDTWVGDDAETFDHISAVGFLDEEQESMVEASKAKVFKGKKGRKKH